jgi:SAM-dependent methyltransferase
MAQTDSAVPLMLERWLAGIDSELRFWDKWMATGGAGCPSEFAERQDPHSRIDPSLLVGIADPLRAKILDVGAGPLTALGKTFEGRRLDITACDPLADLYAELADRHGINRAVRTELAFAEDLSAFYPANHFDVVHCRNALDHSVEPVRGILEMLLVVKSQGHIALSHACNEAKQEGYRGMHQWNFAVDGGRFVIWNREARYDVTEMFGRYADIEVVSGPWVTVVMTKTHELPLDLAARSRDRIRELLPAIMVVFYKARRKPKIGHTIRIRTLKMLRAMRSALR